MSCWFGFVFGLAAAVLKSRRHLLLENAALRHQLLVLSRNVKRPRWRPADRVFWVGLLLVWSRWRQAIRLIQPDTVIHWHRQGFRLFRRWKSRARNAGRKSLASETIALIRQMSGANPLWGAPRIHGELQKLGISVAQRTVSKYMVCQPRRSGSQTWTTFLRNHLGQMVSVDFLTVPTLNFRVLYVFVVLAHARRRGTHRGSGVYRATPCMGTAGGGGSSGWGTVFAVNTDGTGFMNLHNFTATSGSNIGGYGFNSDGAFPYGGLILSGNTLYGEAQCGGTSGYGTVFAVNTDGTGFTNLHTFTATSGSIGGAGINSDGACPIGGLILSDNTLYGTAVQGGTHGWGTVFAVNTDGTGFRNLHSFTAGSDGGYPWDALILSGNTLYGTANSGGSSGYGTVFAVNTDGTGFTTVHSFTGNTGGSKPRAGLVLAGNTLYGTTFYRGGTAGNGTVFAVNTDGTGFAILHSLGGGEGANPYAGLILSGTTLFGACSAGGAYGQGTVFSLSFPSPQLTITPSGTSVNLTWPCAVAGFSYSGCSLQSTTNLGSSAVWGTNCAGPVVVNGQNVVTDPITGTQKFFRLSQ